VGREALTSKSTPIEQRPNSGGPVKPRREQIEAIVRYNTDQAEKLVKLRFGPPLREPTGNEDARMRAALKELTELYLARYEP
jgi:hypothetical protein